MTLMEVIDEIGSDNYIHIVYRTICRIPDGEDEDTFIGSCAWNTKELISLDGDDYCCDDIINSWNKTKMDGGYIAEVYVSTKWWPVDYPQGCKLNCNRCDIYTCEDNKNNAGS